MTHAAILIPGIMGSVLKLGKEVIWPGSPLELVLSYKKMDELMKPELIATDVIRKVSISVQYQDLINDLETCGFRENGNPKTLYVCAYDWRVDNAKSAEKLAAMADLAVQQGATELSLIAHSMGGLISRYFLESGDFAGPGHKAVRRLLTLGTPHRGAPMALSAALGKEKRAFLSADQVHRLASDPLYPSLYQLLPPQGEPFAWNEDKAAKFSDVDIYDPAIAAALKLVPENLDSARKFHAKLDINKRPLFEGRPIRYFFFTGTRQTTVSSVNVLEVTAGKYQVRKTELEDAGDGTVPAWSATITGVQGQPVGGEHSTIYRNGVLRRTMATLLGAKGVLAAQPGQVEVALRERVVTPGTSVHVTLSFGAGVDKLDGTLDIRMAEPDAAGVVTFSRPVSVHPVSYAGLNAETLSVVFSAPGFPGVYQVAYTPENHDTPAGADELFVQEE
jgi:phospholipase A1